MSDALLRHLADAHAFDNTPSHHDLGAYHVAYDELTAGIVVENPLRRAVRTGERVALIGSSGCGKSSVLAAELGPAAEKIAPVFLPVTDAPLERVADASYIADQLINILVRNADVAMELSEDDRSTVLQAATQDRTISYDRASRQGVGLPSWLLRGDLARETSEQLKVEQRVGLDEKTEALNQLLLRLRQDDLMPVLVIDDSDRWTGRDDQRQVIRFLRDIPRWLAALPIATVVAVHESYLGTDDRSVLEFLETRIRIPRLDDPSQVSSLLRRRVELNLPAGPIATIDDLFDSHGAETLFEFYERDGFSIREIVRVVHASLNEAADQGSDSISADRLRATANAG